MAKITPSKRNNKDERETIVVKTKPKRDQSPESFNWWLASKDEVSAQVVDTAAFLKEQQQYRYRLASTHAKLYGNMPLANFAGATINKLGTTNNLPIDRPTMNVVQSCIDTLVSRISQARPRPVFLTDNANYKQRKIGKQLNNFIGGELYQTKAYDLAELILKDAAILGTGCLHVFEKDNRVQLERVLYTELYVDSNDAFYGEPRSMYRLKLVDRSVLKDMLPKYKSNIEAAEQGYPDASSESQKTASDQIMVVEAWHLPSGENTNDGRHVISCTAGILLDEVFEHDCFPFSFIHYSPRLTGLWGQGLSEQLLGTQVEINKLLMTISQSINLVGVPRVFVEEGSKVVKAHLNNSIGSIVTYRGTKPEYEVAPCVPAELYQQLQRLVDYAYQQSGISALAATSQKPAGLNSGEAIRNYDDLQSDRFATLNKRYNNLFIDLAYKITYKAKEICEREGKYQTVYPNKDGTQEVDLPKSDILDNPFVIQCYDSSSLPRDPAGRLQKVTEMMQSGIIDMQEGRRLLDFPDLQQSDKLAMAAKERILQQLDEIVDTGKYEPPDTYTDLMLAKELVVQYYNLYASCELEERKLQMLRDYQSQVLLLVQASMPQAPDPSTGMAPPQNGSAIAVPQAPPVSDTLPITA